MKSCLIFICLGQFVFGEVIEPYHRPAHPKLQPGPWLKEVELKTATSDHAEMSDDLSFEICNYKGNCCFFKALLEPTFQERYSQVVRSGKQNKFSELRFIFFGRNYRKVCRWIKRGWLSCGQHFHLSQTFLFFFSQNLFCFPDRATWEYLSWNVGSIIFIF